MYVHHCTSLYIYIYISLHLYTYVYIYIYIYPTTPLHTVDELILASRLLLASTMVFTYPMECFVARHAMISLIYNYYEPKNADRVVEHNTQNGVGNGTGVELEAFGANKSGNPVPGLGLGPRSVPGQSTPNQYDDTGSGSAPGLPMDMRPSSMNEKYIENDGEVHHITLLQHVAVTLLLWGSSLGIAIASNNLRIVLALTGMLYA